MKRRDFVLSGGAALARVPPALAQSAGGMRTVGVLDPNLGKQEQPRIAAFRAGLAALGWTEGRNVRFDIRYADGDLARLSSVAAELVNAAPAAILAINSPSVLALRSRTRSIPIVFVSASDPVSLGLVASLARPGGNITGFSNYDSAMGSKWLQLLKEIAPNITRVVVLYDLKVPSYRGFVPSIDTAARSARIQVVALPIRTAEDIQQIAALGRKPGTGLIVLPSNATGDPGHRGQIISIAAHAHLPAIYATPLWTPIGGLMSYTDDPELDARRAASDVDRILRGVKPADLPVQNPIKYRLSLNLKTAKALGLTVPQSLLIQADQVIR